jgi:RNA polymerase sigma-70 factor (ECF subfamily)
MDSTPPDAAAGSTQSPEPTCEGLLAAYGRRLFGYFLRATGDYHDAEDLYGEFAVRLTRHVGGYREQGRLEPWLFRIAANLVRDRIRRRSRRPAEQSLYADEGSDAGSPLAARLVAGGPAADEALLRQEARDELQRALQTLDEQSREMILLRHFGQMSFREIAEAFECPVGTALAKVHRGLKALRRQMRDPDGPAEART